MIQKHSGNTKADCKSFLSRSGVNLPSPLCLCTGAAGLPASLSLDFSILAETSPPLYSFTILASEMHSALHSISRGTPHKGRDSRADRL